MMKPNPCSYPKCSKQAVWIAFISSHVLPVCGEHCERAEESAKTLAIAFDKINMKGIK